MYPIKFKNLYYDKIWGGVNLKALEQIYQKEI